MSNKALVFKKIPEGYPTPGEHIAVEPAAYDANVAAPSDGVVVQSLYTSFDPYMRGRMRDASIESYASPFYLNQPLNSRSIGKIVRSNNSIYKEDDLVVGFVPIQEYVALDGKSVKAIERLNNPLNIQDIRMFLGPLGMPGLTAYSSLYEIGKPKKGETIFISAASGAVGQLVGQIAKHEGLKVIGSVGSDEKLNYITKDLGFDSGFNYKNEKPADALKRLAPNGIDIYYENVGGEHLEASLDALNNFGRVVVCGLISQYNSDPYPIKNIHNVLVKRLVLRGFIVGDAGMGDKYAADHQKYVQQWVAEGSFKPLIHETVGIDNSAEGLVGIFHGKNLGKAVLKF